MKTVQDIVSILEQYAPTSLQESYDNAGLICGNRHAVVNKLLLSLDCTEDVVDEAINQKANLIVSHHPILFNGLKSLTGKNYVERVIIKAIKHDIALYAIHTNLDNVIKGVNNAIANKLELKNQRILCPKKQKLFKLICFVPSASWGAVSNAIFEAGAGNIGEYSNCSFISNGHGSFLPSEQANPSIGEAGSLQMVEEVKLETIVPKHKLDKVISALKASHPYEEPAYDIFLLENKHDEIGAGMIGELAQPISESAFIALLKNKFNCKVIRHTTFLNKQIERIAVCGGSGSFLLKDAIVQQADAFVSADFKYHEFFDADARLIIADIGHYESEQFTAYLLFSYLQEKMPNFAVILSKINTNPIKYS